MERSKGKGIQKPCIVCGEDRLTHGAHFPKPETKGGTEAIALCPTHHSLVDNGRISMSELRMIWKNEYARFDSFREFMDWANEEEYPYSMEDILRKDLWNDYEERVISYRIDNSEEE